MNYEKTNLLPFRGGKAHVAAPASKGTVREFLQSTYSGFLERGYSDCLFNGPQAQDNGAGIP
jgi:hypothetical protein